MNLKYTLNKYSTVCRSENQVSGESTDLRHFDKSVKYLIELLGFTVQTKQQ